MIWVRGPVQDFQPNPQLQPIPPITWVQRVSDSDGLTWTECTSRVSDFDEKFSDRIVDIIRCHKKEFFIASGIVID